MFEPRGIALALFAGLFGVVAAPTPTSSQSRDDSSPYERTLGPDDVVDLLDGLGLDPADPQYCEKVRDVCLFGECGALAREKVTKGCWVYCTERSYGKCEQGR